MTGNQICSRCICDTSIPSIRFDEQGICNFCDNYDLINNDFPDNENTNNDLNNIVKSIKKERKDKEYDCIIGVSGGTDSTYCLYYSKKILGLRPLAVHFDDGWNSEMAVTNIQNAISKLDIDLYTYVVDWEEFKDLQLSILKASTPDLEGPTDHGISSALYRIAAEQGIRHILIGNSFKTEGKMPSCWGYADGKYLKYLNKTFGKIPFKTFPVMMLSDIIYYNLLKRIKVIKPLYYIPYNKKEVKKLLERELNWKDYGGHHYESTFTRFVEGYILPKKFGIDKRRIEFSALIRSGQITREKALEMISWPPYPEEQMKTDKLYFIKKFGITMEQFDRIMNETLRSFKDYPSYYPLFFRMRSIINVGHEIGLLPTRFYGTIDY